MMVFRHVVKFLLTCAVLISILAQAAPSWSSSDKPVNFIFLVDVSGSMVSKSTMVTDDRGASTTLFEALRNAIANLVGDERLIKANSRISFITFGTAVTEKSDWPTAVQSQEERKKLLDLIKDPASLSADRKGDTYMGGALNQALCRIEDFLLKSDPCTTTFILMLTDGWDEPPAEAQFKVADVAEKIVQKKRMIKNKIGIDTWQTAVIGLKRLPTSKVGTTTAAQLARMLDGTFLDITQERGKSVSEQIYFALSKILENQRGTITFSQTDPIIDFGTTSGDGSSHASFDIDMLACDQEQITSISEASRSLPQEFWSPLVSRAQVLLKTEKIRRVSELSEGAIRVIPEEQVYTINPNIDSQGRRSAVRKTIKLRCQAGAACPVGTFVGRLKLTSTARIPDSIPYVLSAPARLAIREDSVTLEFTRNGNFTKQDTPANLKFSFVQAPGSPDGAIYHIAASVPEARAKSETLKANSFNQGKPVEIVFDTTKQKSAEISIPLIVPKQNSPGTYEGTIKFEISGPREMNVPRELPFRISMKPTDWERIAPLAVPMAILLVLGMAIYAFLYFVSKTRK